MNQTGKAVTVPDFPELTFDDDRHIYRLDGDVIPSVSRIMEPLKNVNYAGVSERTLRNAADKGTSVHNSIENFIKFGIEDIATEHQLYFNAFLEWWTTAQPVVVGSEIRIYHKILRYGGTVDLLCYIDERLTLIDYKTTYAVSDMSCGVQLEAYEKALESHGIKVDQKMILHLKRDGRFKVIPYPANDSLRWRTFGALKCVYDYTKSYDKKSVERKCQYE